MRKPVQLASSIFRLRPGRSGRLKAALFLACGVASLPGLAAEPLCTGPLAGAYRSSSGSFIVLTTTAKPNGYRWTHQDGRSGLLYDDGPNGTRHTVGWTDRTDATPVDLEACSGQRISFEGSPAMRVPLVLEDTVIDVNGAQLAGRLVRPPASSTSAVPLVVEVQGSGHGSFLESSHRQYLLPASGIAVFVYDKRGTGRSTGQYTQDFHVLAADAAAAYHQAVRLLGDDDRTKGFIGSSQGGWVAPLAAREVNADFVVVNYGLAYSALREDREQVLTGLKNAGWTDPAILKKALDVTEATGRVVTNRDGAAMRDVERLRARYGGEPWWKGLGGEFTAFIANTTAQELARLGPSMDVGTSWEYDPMQTLRSLQARQLWLVAAEDIEAPPVETLRRLRMLQAEGKPLTVVTFPETDHGLKRFDVVDGTRHETRYAAGSQRVVADWIHGRALKPHGDEDFVIESRRQHDEDARRP